MTLPDLHDRRPYTHPSLNGTWRLAAIGPSTITLRSDDSSATAYELITDWPGRWTPVPNVEVKERHMPAETELQAVHTGGTIHWVPKTERDRKVGRSVTASLDTEHGAELVAPGVYLLTDEHHVYAVPSSSIDRINQVTVNTRTGAMRCDGPHCRDRTCSHQRRVLAARAGF